jgi:integrase
MGRQMKLKLPYLQAFRDRHGLMRYYLRRKGRQVVALPNVPGSAEFMAAYQAALGRQQVPGAPNGGSRSLSALFASYYASPTFKNLSPSSQRTYRQVLKPIEARDGHRGVSDLPDDKARKIIEEIGATNPGMANLTRSVLRSVMKHAIKLKWRHSNPFSGIEAYKIGSHRTWTDSEIAAYVHRWPLGSRERIAFDLLYYTAQRIGDVAKMRRDHITGDELFVKQQKTGTELRIRVHPALRRSLNAYGIRGQHLVGRIDGKAISAQMLRAIVQAAAAAAGLPKECNPHGIRKAVLRQLAESGASAKVIAALSGHKSLREVERYTEAADQGRLAVSAIAALPDRES